MGVIKNEIEIEKLKSQGGGGGGGVPEYDGIIAHFGDFDIIRVSLGAKYETVRNTWTKVLDSNIITNAISILSFRVLSTYDAPQPTYNCDMTSRINGEHIEVYSPVGAIRVGDTCIIEYLAERV